MKKWVHVLVLIALLVSAFPAFAQEADGAGDGKFSPGGSQKSSRNIYIVQMADDPVVAYSGGTAGLAATRPTRNAKINPEDPKVERYANYLKGKQDAMLRKVGGGDKLYQYTYTFNGFAAELTEAQAAALDAEVTVLAVSKNEEYFVDTSSTPSFLGLNAPGGLWSKLGGVGKAGENIVIGIVDSGIWPESKSFSDRKPNGKVTYKPLAGWEGACQTGEEWTPENCNLKLIGARYFNEGYGGDAGIDAARPWEFNSPRDYNGHGTHTSSTAGGNYGVQTTGPAAVFGNVSGIAPRARIAMYKALWSTEDASTASGNTADLVAAIDQAVADGVDVINYSISGTQTNFADPAEIAFLFAARAGVFVAASAGNSGPTSSTVAHPSPWITTVAAGTHNRDGQGSVTLGNGVTYNGASVASAVGPAPLINSIDAGLPGADPTALALCFSATDNGGVPVLDPAKVAGKIVVCDRGVSARVNKSLAVQQAGGVGMILLNVSASSLNADFHFVPTVHLADTNRAAVMAYAATAGATATINQANIVYNATAPLTASFSSRGPLRAGGGDLLKPDLIAPGQDILAAVAPPGNAGREFNLYSGTSMSSPHVAGLAALVKNLHPTWSPMMIKSALMTTGYDVLDGGTPPPNTNPVLIFRQGAGHVDPNKTLDPGLAFDSGWYDWLAFLCGTSTAVGASTCNALVGMGYSTDPSDFNSPSIAIGDLAGSQTVTRTVTNVSRISSRYNVSVNMPGVNVVVKPSSFKIKSGESVKLTITFTTAGAPLNSYAGGQLTMTDPWHTVRIPLVVRPVALAAPASVYSTGAPIDFNVRFGYTGAFSATARGLVPAALTPGVVADDPTDGSCALTSPNAQLIPVAIPAGATYARFSLFDADVNPGSDMDLCVFNSGGTLVGSSGSGTSAEEVNLLNPAAGNYTVVVQGWGVDGSSPFVLHTWLLDAAAAGNMTVTAPTSAMLGEAGAINVTFSGLTPGVKYLGSIAYDGAAGMPNPTIVRVDP